MKTEERKTCSVCGAGWEFSFEEGKYIVCSVCYNHRKEGEIDMKTEEKAQHTPGEWERGRTLMTPETRRWSKERIERNDLIEGQLIFSNFSEKDEGRSRICICKVEMGNPDFEANAHLIAAAPDLLEACRLALAISEGKQAGSYDDIMLACRAAIAKATNR